MYTLIDKLNWNEPIDVQTETINSIVNDCNFNLETLLQPKGKELWENAAKCLIRIGFPRVSPVFDGMISWLQDMNWPGAYSINSYILTLPNDIVSDYLIYGFKKSILNNDVDWQINLTNILLEKKISYSSKLSFHENEIINKIIESEYDSIFINLKMLINEWDPIGLISGGAPEDEYDSEIKEFISIIRSHNDENVFDILNSIFKKNFGEEYYLEEDKDIIEEILKIIRHST